MDDIYTPKEDMLDVIAAAKASLQQKRSHAISDIEQRLKQVLRIEQLWSDGQIGQKAVQERIGQLVSNESRNTSTSPKQTGRTAIGLGGLSGTLARTNQTPTRLMGPSIARTTAAIQHIVGIVDSRLSRIINTTHSSESDDTIFIELALLRRMRSILQEQLEYLPEDIVLLESINEFTESCQKTIEGLQSEGSARLMSLHKFSREILIEMNAHGTTEAFWKKEAKTIQRQLDNNEKPTTDLHASIIALFRKLYVQSTRTCLDSEKNLIDTIIRNRFSRS